MRLPVSRLVTEDGLLDFPHLTSRHQLPRADLKGSWPPGCIKMVSPNVLSENGFTEEIYPWGGHVA